MLPRQRRILDKMHALGWLNDEQHRVALAQSIVLQRFSGGFEAPHAVEMLRGQTANAPVVPAITMLSVPSAMCQSIS